MVSGRAAISMPARRIFVMFTPKYLSNSSLPRTAPFNFRFEMLIFREINLPDTWVSVASCWVGTASGFSDLKKFFRRMNERMQPTTPKG